MGHLGSQQGVLDLANQELVDEVFGCFARFDNPNGMLLSGGTGKVILPTSLHNAIVIPQEATYDIQDKVYVVKVVEGSGGIRH